MPVADKYRPVRTAPRTLDAPGPVFASLTLTAALLALLSPTTLRNAATFGELPPAGAAALTALADVGDATGLGALRSTLERWTEPLDDTRRLFARGASAPDTRARNDAPEVPVEPATPPGERWAATRPPVAERLLIVGASSIQYAIGTELERELRERFAVETLRKGKVSTGLSRPDVFDWPAEVRKLQRDFQPDVVVGQFGGNDAQNLVTPEGPAKTLSDPWKAEYARRLDALTGQVRADGADLVILGMPVMREPGFSSRMERLNALTAATVEAAGRYVPTWDLAADADGRYEETARVDGRTGRMRQDDGIHFTRLGGQQVADALAVRLAQTVPLRPLPRADGLKPAPAWRFEVPSATRGPSPVLAWVPDEVPADGLPVWVLLHGAYDGHTAWSDHAHEAIGALAARWQLIVVTPDGEPHGWWLDSPKEPGHRLATWFHDDLLPWIDATLPSNGARGVSGLSMGGHGALTLALRRPGTFQAVTSMSGVVDLPAAASREALQRWLGAYDADAPELWEAHSARHLLAANPSALQGVTLALACGEEDTWFADNAALHAQLTAAGVPHVWRPVPGGHTWDVWTAELPVHAELVATALHPSPPPPPAPPQAPPDPGVEGDGGGEGGSEAPSAP